MDFIFTWWLVWGFLATIMYLLIVSFHDLKTRTIPLDWTRIFFEMSIFGLGLISIVQFNPLIIIMWFVGNLAITIPTFLLLKKDFGGGDFWMLLTIQSLNPLLPIPFVSYLVHGIAGITAFIFRKKWEDKDKKIPFAPFYLAAYLAISFIVIGIQLFLL